MSNFLKNNQKTEIRARISNDIILYEPSEEQIIKLKELMQEQQIKFDDNLNATGNVSYDAVRYIIKELLVLSRKYLSFFSVIILL